MDRPGNNFAAGNIWAGPTGRSWGLQLTAKRTTFVSELNRLDDEVTAKLATTPRTCPEEELLTWKMRLGNG